MGIAYEIRGLGLVKGDKSGCQIAVYSDALMNDMHSGGPICAKGKAFSVEKCILWELTQLWEQGIKTLCSCCGHGKFLPRIVVGEQDAQKMRDLGYEEIPSDVKRMGMSCGLCGVSFKPKDSEYICKE